ncbi:DUF202 domain-containing protein [Microbacterium sp. YY-01]|uniref:DUF202 domain-containing protein n=1 Tax=Microbacterium sp. YY-01 TaxID=3421634 RepID=UPI003D171064
MVKKRYPGAEAPFDAGLQPERTLLAWRRTALALGLGGVAATRFTAHELGIAAVGAGIAGLVMAVVAYLLASARYSRVHRHLSGGSMYPSGGRSIIALAAAAFFVGLAGLSYVVGSVLGSIGL